MLQNELNDYCLKRPEHSLFNIVNLEDCIATCHDAIECEAISDFITHRRKSRKCTLNFDIDSRYEYFANEQSCFFPE